MTQTTLSILFGIDRVIPCQKATEKLVKLSQINFYVENQTGTKNLKTFDFLSVKIYILVSDDAHLHTGKF